jgi:D-cysteine desulfhydrase
MVLGAVARSFRGRVLAISIDATVDELTGHVTKIAHEAAALARVSPDVTAKIAPAVQVNADYLGGGYSVVGDLERDAIRTVARTEGLLLDPVYTGRAMGGMIDLIKRGTIAKGERVLFWHTGGTAAMSAFAEKL